MTNIKTCSAAEESQKKIVKLNHQPTLENEKLIRYSCGDWKRQIFNLQCMPGSHKTERSDKFRGGESSKVVTDLQARRLTFNKAKFQEQLSDCVKTISITSPFRLPLVMTGWAL